jgi:hypothetical protein
MNIIFSLSTEYASHVREGGVTREFECSVPREDFMAAFPGIDYSNIRQLAYETELGFYHINEASDGSLTAIEDPESDERMAYIHANIEAIKAWFDEKKREEEAAY